MYSLSEINSQLQNTSLISERTLEKLKEIMYDRTVCAGSNLFLEGDPADKLYFIKKGSVKVFKIADDGKDLTLYYFGPGDLVGEMECCAVNKCTFNAVTLNLCQIGVIQQRDLETLLWKGGDLSIEMMKWMGYMQKMTKVKLRDLLFFGKQGALASTLIRMANTYGRTEDAQIKITKKFNNYDLACLIGSTRETVNRMLNQLKRENVLNYENGHLVILNLLFLKKICHCEECPIQICRL